MSNVEGPYIGMIAEPDYAEFLAMVADPANFPPTYPAFKAHIESILATARAQGLYPIQIPMKPANLQAWCKSAGRAVDAKARMEYAIMIGSNMQ